MRPSHTYDERNIPIGVHGNNGSWQVLKRMMENKPVIIQGDGTSLWALTFNDDFAIVYVALMVNPDAIGQSHPAKAQRTRWVQNALTSIANIWLTSLTSHKMYNSTKNYFKK